MRNMLGTLIDTFTTRRRAHLLSEALELELAGFSSQNDRLELDTILDRYSDTEADEIRDILHRRDAIHVAA